MAASGVLATTTERGTWVAPANRVTWTPPGFDHCHRFYGRTERSLVEYAWLAALAEVPADPLAVMAVHSRGFAAQITRESSLFAVPAHRHPRTVAG